MARTSALVAGLSCAIACLLMALPSFAVALEPGVHVNPGSPTGQEYQIPLVHARGSGASSQALFGEGITRAPSSSLPSSAATDRATRGAGTRRRDKGHRASARARQHAREAREASLAPSMDPLGPGGGGTGTVWTLAAPAAVLAAAALGAAAVVLRRRRGASGK